MALILKPFDPTTRSRSKGGLAVILLSLAMAGSFSRLGAQVLYGSLTGNITDASGAAVPNARVEALNTATGLTKQTNTDDRGIYLFSDLQPGPYKVTVSATSFTTAVRENVPINGNTVRRVDARLQVAQITETVTVSAASATLQTDRADVNIALQNSQLVNLPIGGQRNFQRLYQLIPGFSPPRDAHSIAGNPQRALVTNVNGVSYSTNNTKLDGATISYPWLPHIIAYVPPAEAVETVNIVTNSFDAEQGMAGGAAINVAIRSGTNEYHGAAYWYHTNSALRARNFFFLGNRLPKNILNQPGFAGGGPIKKNKLFFFGDWERTSQRENASRFLTIPTAALRQGGFGGAGVTIHDPATGNRDGTARQPFPENRIPSSRFDPAPVKLIQNLPPPNLSGFPNNHFVSASLPFDRDNGDVKINYNPTERAALFGRYSISQHSLFDPQPLGPGGGPAFTIQPGFSTSRIQSVTIGGNLTLTPHVILDGNAGFTRQRLAAENTDLDVNHGLVTLGIPGANGPDRLQGGYPIFDIPGFSSLGNPNASNPFKFRDNQYVGNANLGWTRGAHSLRFGWETNRFAINHFQPQAASGPRGRFTFTGGLTALRSGPPPILFNSFADFLLGLPQSMGKDLQFFNPGTVRTWSHGFFARDQWQLSRKLTLTLGVRYEYNPMGTRDNHGADRYDPEIDRVLIGGIGNVPGNTGIDVGRGQLAPRFGIAYRVTEKTVIRAGYGISIDPHSFQRLRDAYPATISAQFSGNSSWEAAGSLRTGIPQIRGVDLGDGIIEMPRTVGTITFPKKFNRGYVRSFNFTVQRDLAAGFSFQAGYVGTRAIRQMARININAAPPGGGNAGRALAARYGRTANIDQLTPFQTATYDSLQTQFTRRLTADSQLGVVYTLSKAINYTDNSDSALSFNWPGAFHRNRGLAGFDRAHNLQIYGIYDLPFGRARRWARDGVLAAIAGGWQLNGVLSAMSGAPFTVGSSGASLNAPGNAQTADQVRREVRILGGVGRGNSYFDPAAFAAVSEVRFGTSGRNILRGPGIFNLDAGLFRKFSITERFQLQFRAEAFNFTNTPAFNNPGASASAPTRNPDGSIRALNGYTEILSAEATERQFRFALRLSF